MARGRGKQSGGGPAEFRPRAQNQILKLLPRTVFQDLEPWLQAVELKAGSTIFEPGDDISHTYFPLGGTVVALVLSMRDGRAVEAATIGREGAVGGVISLGTKPAYARGLVQISGSAVRVPIGRIEALKRASPKLHDILVRYADCLIAQVLQSVGCSTVHTLEARCARWLLTTHDRLQNADLPLTQEALAEMFGVARTYLTRVANDLQKRGAISYRRGVVHIERRKLLEQTSCECYGAVRRHYERILPGLYPDLED